MGNRALENRIKKLQEIEAEKKALEAQAEALKAEIKKEMEAQGTDELHTGNFIIRWKSVLSTKFDNMMKQTLRMCLFLYNKSPLMRLVIL